MRTTCTWGFTANGQAVAIHGPDTPIPAQEEGFRAFLRQSSHPEFVRVELWYGDGTPIRTVRLKPAPDPVAVEAPKRKRKE
ncbi:MAG: hypothetical protein M1608_05225 [Candidatus Omnitrophica bacterium]|nr:hypothetical protein [Candidatus Omnitrophota bacterium]